MAEEDIIALYGGSDEVGVGQARAKLETTRTTKM